MSASDDNAPLIRDAEEAGESPHFGSTFSGCLGLVCILALPALLFLPLDNFSVAHPLDRLIPLIGVGISGLGVWLVARVPIGAARAAADPLHPLTGEGRVPLREEPATQMNRLSFAAASILVAGCVLGAIFVVLAPRARDVLLGTLICVFAGGALVVYATLAARGGVPSPALHWVRVPIRGGAFPPVAFMLVGGVSLVWALLIAFEAGYVWAAAATTLVILLGLLAGPVGQRFPPRTYRR